MYKPVTESRKTLYCATATVENREDSNAETKRNLFVTTHTYVPPQNSTDMDDPPGPSGSDNSSSTGIPTETTRTGSGYT